MPEIIFFNLLIPEERKKKKNILEELDLNLDPLASQATAQTSDLILVSWLIPSQDLQMYIKKLDLDSLSSLCFKFPSLLLSPEFETINHVADYLIDHYWEVDQEASWSARNHGKSDLKQYFWIMNKVREAQQVVEDYRYHHLIELF